ncbi:MAG TPA: DUF4347 domain-containing protein [Roseomonas sp.]|nr:DUF4347 domain-containing protein [Roseomonas sp.]
MTDFAETAPIPSQLLVLDPRQPGWGALVANTSSDTAVLLLDPQQDGLQQLVDVAAIYAPLQNIQLPDHGEAGRVILGTRVLDRAHLGAASELLAELAGFLAPGGAVQLTGRPGQGPAGRNLADLLSRLIGRRVHAARNRPVAAAAASGAAWPVWSQEAPTVHATAAGSV